MPSTASKTLRRVAILEKAGTTAAISIYSCPGHLHAVANFDPRHEDSSQIYRRSFETRTEAVAAFDEYIAVSRDRGWTVTYNAPPNFG